MSQELLDGLKRRLTVEPDNTFLRARVDSLKARLGLTMDPRKHIPGPMVNDYLFAGRAIATVQWEEDGVKRHLTYSIRQHLLKKGGKVVKRLPVYHVWYRERDKQYNYLLRLERRDNGLETTLFSDKFDCLVVARGHLNKVIEGNSAYKVYHDGTCGRCLLELTHPESIRRGIGPVCSGVMTKEKRVENC